MPVRYILIKRSLIPTLLGLILFCMCGVAKGQTSTGIVWQSIETKHTIIRYQSEKNLKKFNSRIKYRVERAGLKGLFSSSGSSDLKSTVSKKVDALFEKAQQILDMRKKNEKSDHQCLSGQGAVAEGLRKYIYETLSHSGLV